MRKIAFVIVFAAFAVCFSTVEAASEADIQAAIDSGLVWLAGKQNPGDGSWGISYQVGKTAMAVKKFEHDAILREYTSPFDPLYPYHQVVEDGLHYIFLHASIVPISVQTYGDPDTDGDGIGVRFATVNRYTYETGLALMAIVESNTPDQVVVASGSPVQGWTYYDVAVDAMNWLAYAQIDAGSQRGCWGYDANSGGDQSNSGYATLGLGYAEASPPEGFGIAVPQFVKDELGGAGLWVDYIQNDANGGSGYTSPTAYLSILETGNTLFQQAWYGDDVTVQRVIDAIDYIANNWHSTAYNPLWPAGWLNSYQAMYTMMKGLEALAVDTIPTVPPIDWFDEVSDTIVAWQHPNGSWGPGYWDLVHANGDTVLSTTWALLTLQKAAPPVHISVALDIKPQSCPNPLNTKEKGVLPVAILGTEDFDVTLIDPSTILLEGVAPLRWSIEDVATPFEGELCDCTTEGPDCFDDLTLKFSAQEIVAALGEVYDGDVLVLTLTGELIDGRPFLGSDCVIIRMKNGGVCGREVAGGIPISVTCHPNPFSSEASISYSIGSPAHITVEIYDITGQLVTTLIDQEKAYGYSTIRWDGKNASGVEVPSGTYFCRFTADEMTSMKKMVLLR